MTKVVISNAKPDDVTSIIALLADDPIGQMREDTSPNAQMTYQRAFAAAVADPNCTILVARSGSDVVGCIQMNMISGLSYRGSRRILIEDMRVITLFRGKGIGRQLMDAALQQAKDSGCQIAELFAHEDRISAHGFYEACGFIGHHKGFRRNL